VLSVLSRPEHGRTMRDLILDQTSTLGVRESRVRRWALDRGWVDVTVDGHPVAVKVALRDRVVVHAAPEFEDVRGVAARTGRPVRAVLEEASSAAVAAGLVRGGRAPEVLRTRLAR